MAGFRIRSTSNWEESEFGGYRKVLWDYPELSISNAIDWELPREGRLTYYLGGKLVKLFLIKCTEKGFINALTAHMTIVKGEKFPFFSRPDKAVIDKKDIQKVLEALIPRDKELGSMFEHYKEELLGCEISIEIPKDKDDKEGEDKKPGTGKDDKLDAKQLAALQKALQSGEERKSIFERTYTTEDKIRDITVTFDKVSKSAGDIRYTAQEKLYADQLVRMLDISFESERDKIKSLRSGKIDPSKIAEFLAGNGNIYYKIEEDQITRPFSICILGDFSGSMGGLLEYQAECMKVLFLAFSQIMPKDKIFVYGHSGRTNSVVYTFNEPGYQYFEKTAHYLGSLGREQNYDGPAIEAVHQRVRAFTDDNIIFIALSDGEPGGEDYGGWPAVNHMKKVIEKAKRDGFVTGGIGLQLGLVKEIYHYHTIVMNMDKLVSSTATLLNRVVKTEFQ